MKDESVLFTLIIFWIGIKCFNYPPEFEVLIVIGRLGKIYFLKSLWKSLSTDDIIQRYLQMFKKETGLVCYIWFPTAN